MNKRYLLLIPIIAFVIIITINLVQLISYKLMIVKYEKMFLNYYNLKFSDGLSHHCALNINDYINNRPTEYNITELINYYLSQIDDKKLNEVINYSFYNNTRYHIDLAYDYSKYIKEDNLDINFVVKELKKILIYRDKNWFLDGNSPQIIELPYGYYINYKKENFEKLNIVQKALKVHFVDKINFKDDKNNRENAQKYNLEIEYLDMTNKVVKVNRLVTYYKDTKLWGDSLNDLYYKIDGIAEIYLHHHTYDKEKEEEEKRMNDIQTEFQEMMQEYEANLSDEERYFNPAAGN